MTKRQTKTSKKIPAAKRPDHCPDHPYYHGDRRAANGCAGCLRVWQMVNAAEEAYFAAMRQRTLGGASEDPGSR